MAHSFGSDGERPTSNLSCTAVDTLLTFYPPGPEARTNTSSIGGIDGNGGGDVQHGSNVYGIRRAYHQQELNL